MWTLRSTWAILEAIASREHDHTRAVFIALLLAGLAYTLSQTVVSPALPELQHRFHATPGSIAWILTGYFLSAAVATPIIGKLGDLYGRPQALTVVLIGFAIGSAICALAGSLPVLIAGRVFQGVAGGIFPLAFGIIREGFPRERVATAIGGLSATFGIGGGLGLVLAGLIVDALNTSWLFWVGMLALPAAYIIWRDVPRERTPSDARVDWLGAGVLSIGLVALLYGLSQANAWGWTSGRVLGLVAAGLAIGVLWVWIELRVDQPLIEMRILSRRPMLLTNLAAVLVGFSMFAAFIVVPQLAQTPSRYGYGFGATVTGAGALMVPCTIMMLIGAPLAGRLLVRFDSRLPMVLGSVLMAVAFGLFAAVHAHPWEVALIGALMGTGVGLAFAAMANIVVEAVRPEEVGVATGINTIMRSLGAALGAQLVATLLTSQTLPHSTTPSEGAYTDAFIAAGGAAAVATVLSVAIPRLRREPLPVSEPEPAEATATV